jgi:hypothetical protein
MLEQSTSIARHSRWWHKGSFEEFIGDYQRHERPANIATARHSVKFAQAVKSSRNRLPKYKPLSVQPTGANMWMTNGERCYADHVY